MDDGNRNDYDTLADKFSDVMSVFVGALHEAGLNDPHTSALAIDKTEAMRAIIRLQRTINWCRGLADSHRKYSEVGCKMKN